MKNQKGSTDGFELIFALLVVLFTGFGCYRSMNMSDEIAVRHLENTGYSDVQVVSKTAWWVGFKGCGYGDSVQYEVSAKNPLGKTVTVYVCSSWLFKGSTTRTF